MSIVYMSQICLFFASHEPYNLNLNYDLVGQLNEGDEGTRDHISFNIRT